MTAVTLANTAMKAGYLNNESGWGTDMNLNLRTLDSLVQGRVADKDLSTPPTTPTPGTVYIVGPAATGAWATHSGQLAVWDAGDDITAAWRFITPKAGWHFFVVDENDFYRYTGSVWVKGLTDIPAVKQTLMVPCTDEITPIGAVGQVMVFHAAFGFTLQSAMVGLTTPQTDGAILTFDVKRNGVSIFTTKPSIDNTEDTSLTASTPAALIATTLVAGDKLTVHVDQVGTPSATGMKLYLVGVAST